MFGLGGQSRAEQRRAADRFRARLKLRVAMTSNVKDEQQVFLGLHDVFVLSASAEPEPVRDAG
jgi:hypothetical protein